MLSSFHDKHWRLGCRHQWTPWPELARNGGRSPRVKFARRSITRVRIIAMYVCLRLSWEFSSYPLVQMILLVFVRPHPPVFCVEPIGRLPYRETIRVVGHLWKVQVALMLIILYVELPRNKRQLPLWRARLTDTRR